MTCLSFTRRVLLFFFFKKKKRNEKKSGCCCCYWGGYRHWSMNETQENYPNSCVYLSREVGMMSALAAGPSACTSRTKMPSIPSWAAVVSGAKEMPRTGLVTWYLKSNSHNRYDHYSLSLVQMMTIGGSIFFLEKKRPHFPLVLCLLICLAQALEK